MSGKKMLMVEEDLKNILNKLEKLYEENGMDFQEQVKDILENDFDFAF